MRLQKTRHIGNVETTPVLLRKPCGGRAGMVPSKAESEAEDERNFLAGKIDACFRTKPELFFDASQDVTGAPFEYMRLFFLGAVFLAFPILLSAKNIPASVTRPAPFQGETVIVRFFDSDPKPVGATFDGKAIPVFPYKNGSMAIAGIAATKIPGRYPLKVNFEDGSVFSRSILVRGKRFLKVALGSPIESDLTPAQFAQAIQEEKANLEAVFAEATPSVFWNGSFGLPLYRNRVSTRFGTIYKTGENEVRHLGADFAAPLGTLVASINGGRVRRAYYHPAYGNTVIVDHGFGIFSMYLHLKDLRVEEGETLKKGSIVGTVGQSGYATGPHLHLSLRVGGVTVDPVSFAGLFR